MAKSRTPMTDFYLQSKAGCYMKKLNKPKISTLSPWYGCGRMVAAEIGAHLKGCKWIGVPFAGGMSEFVHFDARTMLANDLHCHIINLARIVAHPKDGPKLYRRLRRVLFHPRTLEYAQNRCREIETAVGAGDLTIVASDADRIDWAENYFICAWMSRNGKAGCRDELSTGISLRWEAGGGDSAKRFSSAIFSLRSWHQILARWTFTCLDAFEFIAACKDRNGHGIYCDAPWPDAGDAYKHKFTKKDQCRLALVLSKFKLAKVVIRFGDHPWIRALYPESHWTWHLMGGRTQAK